MTQLLLVRHAEPLAAQAEAGSALGADPGLSEKGTAQAASLARWLADAPERAEIEEVVVSPMRRARETAAPVASLVGEDAVVVHDLAEYDRGHHEYRPVHEMSGSDDPHWARIRSGLFPEFVDADAFTGRVTAAFAEVLARHAGRGTVLAVCHAGVINTYLAALLGLDRPLVFPLDHVSLTRVLASRSGERRVRSINETQHVVRCL